jgi:ethanolamine utilization cobalamin adenosyltransferase
MGKPEHLTHLNRRELVRKTHPRIAFRGRLDSLEAELLLCQKTPNAPVAVLQEMLLLMRSLMRADVLEEPVSELRLWGMDEKEIRERSHQPMKYYGIGFFVPSHKDSLLLLQLNRLRASIRETELLSYHAFPTRTDIHRALNRLSSLCWLLCLEEKTHGTID